MALQQERRITNAKERQMGARRTLSPGPGSESDEPIEVEAMTEAQGLPNMSAKLVSPPSKESRLEEKGSKIVRMEEPLWEYMPSAYICVLEGRLLANGDLKGKWRIKRGDRLANEFRMVLMDRGLYHGSFNYTNTIGTDPATSVVDEVHDKWFEVKWCATTGRTFNVWGHGRNMRFGEFFLLGSHDALTCTLILYKVDEDELKRAQMYARDAGDPLATAALFSCMPQTRQKRQQKQQKQIALCSSNRSSNGTTTNPVVLAAPTGEPTIGQAQRPRPCPANGGGDFVAAATALIQTESIASNGSDGTHAVVGKRRIYPPGHPANNRSRAQRYHTVRIVGSLSSCVSSDSGSDSDSNPGGDDATRGRPTSALPSGEVVPPPSKILKSASQISRGPLPGFSGLGDDEEDEEEDGKADARVHDSDAGDRDADSERQRDITGLAFRAAKLREEKGEITENFSALALSLGNAKADLEQRISSAQREEQIMLKKLRDLRRKLGDDQRDFIRLTIRMKRSKEEEVQLLDAWNKKWAVEVEPFIEQHEKEVKRKAHELEKKTKEAEKQKQQLQQEVAQLQDVKQMTLLKTQEQQQQQPA